ncbi:MAG: glutamate synthase subunit beta [Kofleriaceae bacterium]
MGKPTGFIEWRRLTAPRRPVAERLTDWREVEAHADGAALRQQAGRCMDCGVPFCMQGCPLGNPIPDFNDRVWRDQWQAAWHRLAATNNFPEFTGRLCPAPCEAACVLGLDGAPVTIEHVEKELAERAWAEGWVTAQPAAAAHRTGRRVAVVGSGPAGLACAQQLARAGHTPVVYEAADQPGGLLRYGIPDFKLDKAVLARRLAQLTDEGVEFRCGVTVGVEPTWDRLRADHDAVVVAIGAGRPRELTVPGRDLAGVTLAMDYLEDGNRAVATGAAARHSVHGQRVVILGGGDTGSDCLGTALRQGALEVTQLELMPAPPEARPDDNPWPTWPQTLRTSSSHEEGGARVYALRTTRLDGVDGRVAALVAERLAPRPGTAGRHPGELVATGEEVVVPCDRVILAMGFTGPVADTLATQLGVALDRRGNVAVDACQATTAPGVFAAGDVHKGASLIVWAIALGRETARHVDGYLRDGASLLPALGQDQPFDRR